MTFDADDQQRIDVFRRLFFLNPDVKNSRGGHPDEIRVRHRDFAPIRQTDIKLSKGNVTQPLSYLFQHSSNIGISSIDFKI